MPHNLEYSRENIRELQLVELHVISLFADDAQAAPHPKRTAKRPPVFLPCLITTPCTNHYDETSPNQPSKERDTTQPPHQERRSHSATMSSVQEKFVAPFLNEILRRGVAGILTLPCNIGLNTT